MNLKVDKKYELFKKITIYETKNDFQRQKQIIVVGKSDKGFNILKIKVVKIVEEVKENEKQKAKENSFNSATFLPNRHQGIQQHMTYTTDSSLEEVLEEEHQPLKTEEELKNYLQKDRLKKVCQAQGIIGFTKFLEGYYMLVVTSKQTVAKLGQHKIYKIRETKLFTLYESGCSSTTRRNEKKYKKIFQDFDLQLGFYFSTTYDLTNSLSVNLQRSLDLKQHKQQQRRGPGGKHNLQMTNTHLCWNTHLMQEFSQTVANPRWMLCLVHGYIEQQLFQYQTQLHSLTLIARRSRQHAGTRYLKRGINETGHVANFVETEQILIDKSFCRQSIPVCCSFLQIRGSIPLFWYQEAHVYNPKPQIKINHSDPYYISTKQHFEHLLAKYGEHIFLVNLVKSNEKQPREQKLATEYKKAVDFVNLETKHDDNYEWQYIHMDLKKLMKRDMEEFFERTTKLALYFLFKHGLFSLISNTRGDSMEQKVEFQNGTIRSNCIDCLDRTNYFQQIVGEVALGIQFQKLAGQQVNGLEFVDLRIAKKFRKMYERMGDLLSIQYGGSIAHKQSFMKNSEKHKIFEFMTSIKRYINNSFSDNYKQQTIDLFLTLFKPKPNNHIWHQQIAITLYPDYKLLSHLEHKTYWIQRAIDHYKSQQNLDEIQNKNSEIEIFDFMNEIFSQSFRINSNQMNFQNFLQNKVTCTDNQQTNQQYKYTLKIDPQQQFYQKNQKKKKLQIKDKKQEKIYNRMTLLPIKVLETEENEEIKDNKTISINNLDDIRIRRYSSISISNLSQHSDSEEYKLYEDYNILQKYLQLELLDEIEMMEHTDNLLQVDTQMMEDYKQYVDNQWIEKEMEGEQLQMLHFTCQSVELDTPHTPKQNQKVQRPVESTFKNYQALAYINNQSNKVNCIQKFYKNTFGKNNKTIFQKI